ncbi:MAG TPA: hypothetical protein VGM63_13815 [Mucilaginibacter sp.]
MKHALERLRVLITTDIEPARIQAHSFTHTQLKNWTEMVHKERENICLHFFCTANMAKSERQLRSFFRRQQLLIVNLLDIVFSYKVLHPDSPMNDLYTTLLNTLEQLWIELRDQYKNYFNLHERVPDFYRQLVRQNLLEEWDILNKLVAHRPVDPQLVRLAMKPIGHFFTNKNNYALAYSYITYVKALIAELTEWAVNSSDDPEWGLISVLIYMNVNSRGLRTHCFNYINTQLSGTDDPGVKLLRLEVFYKDFQQLTEDRNKAFNPGSDTLKSAIEKWFKAEISLLEKRVTAIPNDKPASKSRNKDELEKLPTDIAVNDWGVVAVGLLDIGVIKNVPAIGVMRILAHVLKTDGQEEMSAESMQKHYKEVKASALERMAGMALDLHYFFKDFRKQMGA